ALLSCGSAACWPQMLQLLKSLAPLGAPPGAACAAAVIACSSSAPSAGGSRWVAGLLEDMQSELLADWLPAGLVGLTTTATATTSTTRGSHLSPPGLRIA
ncbi:unnamed protein product, partial [Polarella glacialis]